MTDGPALRMLFPDRVDEVDVHALYADMPVVAGRAAVRLNMIGSVDGGTSWNGVSGALGGAADKQLFTVLRSLADMVLVASGTMRAEQYGPAVLPAEVQQARLDRGQRAVPPIAVVSGSCKFDWSSPFFAAATERPLIVTVAQADEDRRREAARVADVVIAGDTDVDMHRAVQALGERGATTILAEGGPTLNGQLAQARLLDELCVTLAPLLASGDAKRIVSGSPLAELERLRLVSLCQADDYLFFRYRPVG
ncbi:MAG TPA: pyrimidine reductase family protein [Acidimicrobiia bacterium]